MPYITTNDGTQYYEEKGRDRPLVMIHGWSFSGRFFHRNVDAFAEHARVITIDLRGHGESGKPDHGYRIPRLAADLRDVLVQLDLTDVTVPGWSLGCPVIWSYPELFGQERLRAAIFVQQTPRQYYSPDWKPGHATCYDQAGLVFTQQRLTLNSDAFDEQNLSGCLRHPLPHDEKRFLLAEMKKCPSYVRSTLMADHTVHDWRDLLPHLNIPALVMVAKKDTVLNPGGPAWVAVHMPHARAEVFEDSAHMIFIDETEKFNASVVSFLKQ
ncbi:alpha/beta fold hydrolase [Acetobacter oeni]|uniref:alpha/beta fold hydrolase n=1 Tax=Acetobacter oeni TaxID=304077 RepID=UPI0011BEC69B|nr:alpha/beta hydrolase [Acetobacter oeni]MBB3882480.1 pimeloyl-ACP methyl ester carboxylesterase [Acetobacter oeni]NHO18706.1 alpha/beta fold hydrolase [Acetobacter oeni]